MRLRVRVRVGVRVMDRVRVGVRVNVRLDAMRWYGSVLGPYQIDLYLATSHPHIPHALAWVRIDLYLASTHTPWLLLDSYKII